MTSIPAAHVATLRRPRWRAYLLLSRISNLPTVWTNVLAGMCVASATIGDGDYLRVAAAMSAFYTGGMFLNDAFDEPFDRRVRPERPIPSVDVSRNEVFRLGALLLLVGEMLLAPRGAALLFGALLAAAIVWYDARHKGSSFAPVVMGSCRGLVYCTAAAFVSGISGPAVAAAIAVTVYVAGLTVVAKLAGARARWLVPMLIAAISLVDAIVIALSGSPTLAAMAIAGFPLTLFLQRFVPGD
jgi:4-hydroxybenzoate polyprenyltransferase